MIVTWVLSGPIPAKLSVAAIFTLAGNRRTASLAQPEAFLFYVGRLHFPIIRGQRGDPADE